eukprot:COSAG02_NODE_158_length_32954_cov_16.416771_26_plen_78_part_00
MAVVVVIEDVAVAVIEAVVAVVIEDVVVAVIEVVVAVEIAVGVAVAAAGVVRPSWTRAAVMRKNTVWRILRAGSSTS